MATEPKQKKTKAPKPFLTLDADPKVISLADAAKWVRDHQKGGAVCPCCDQLAKRYQRKLASSMAAALILIRRAFRTQSDWLHVPEYLTSVALHGPMVRGGDWAKLAHWKLIVAKHDEDRPDGSKRNGLYKMTELGIDFVERRVEVPRYAYIYAQKLIGLSEQTITIDEALQERFNYGELMAQ